MARALDDEDVGVRQLAINFFSGDENDKAPLNLIPTKDKRAILPLFIIAAQDTANWGLRNNAVGALGYYSEAADTVVPVLGGALKDPQVMVRMRAAESLFAIMPERMGEDEAFAVVLGVLKDPDDQVAWRAASLLGKMKIRPADSVPALITELDNPSSLVASQCAWSLEWFPQQKEIIVTALVKSYESTNHGQPFMPSLNTLYKLDPETAARIHKK